MAIAERPIGVDAQEEQREEETRLEQFNANYRLSMGLAWNAATRTKDCSPEKTSAIILLADIASNAPNGAGILIELGQRQGLSQPWSNVEEAKRIEAMFRKPPKRKGPPIEVFSALPKGK